MPALRSVPCSCSVSSMARNGPISISLARPGRSATPSPCPRARPASVCACSSATSPPITRIDRSPVTEIGFYHLTKSSVGEALPRLLERAVAAGHRILVRAANEAETERLNSLLWTYGEASFLPHGSAKDG